MSAKGVRTPKMDLEEDERREKRVEKISAESQELFPFLILNGRTKRPKAGADP